uniref:Protein transport protein sec16 n=1 Tax=Chenopodium quinoa TaxID=63459 RepID=A0A803ND44_CHEQI
MASIPPFELEDQTDEDFFDKLVNDDDDDDVSSKTTGLIHASDLLDGNESDELKEFANLSAGEISRGDSGTDTVKVVGNCDNMGIQSLEARGEQEEGNGNFYTEAKAVPGNEARKNEVTESSLVIMSIKLHGSDGVLNGQESFDITAGNIQGTFGANGDSLWKTSNVQSSQNFNAQQTAQSAVGTISQLSMTENLSGHNSILQQYEETQYPAHMIFDSQYPGWYYDTIAQQWFSLEVYHATDQTSNSQVQNGFLSSAGYTHASSTSSQGINNDGLQGPRGEGLENFVATTNFSVVPSWQRFNDNNSYVTINCAKRLPLVPQDLWKHTSKQVRALQNEQPTQYPTGHYSSQNAAAVPQPLFSNAHHVSYTPSEGRSSAGRPPHALVTFGFGGKLVVMKDNNIGGFSALGSKDSDGCFLSVLNLMEVVSLSKDPSCSETNMNKWIDDKISNSESLEMNYGKRQGSKLLLSLLKIACQHYGKLRSFGGDTGLKENDLPESAVAKLFASSKRSDGQFNVYNAISNCLMTLPSEAQIQTTATEVQNLLISGRKKEALQRAQDGHLWGFALILARELGIRFVLLYADTVKKMAVSQLVVGSPLRTLCLLIARKPEEVFCNSTMPANDVYEAVNMLPQSMQYAKQNAGFSMLENWEENLAVITANRTENDHLVIIHLGDCLLKEKHDVTAAHICYLVAEAGFEQYSDSARLCLIGADHWNFPRTYASPEAIQMTELYEYAKVLGNSQF